MKNKHKSNELEISDHIEQTNKSFLTEILEDWDNMPEQEKKIVHAAIKKLRRKLFYCKIKNIVKAINKLPSFFRLLKTPTAL